MLRFPLIPKLVRAADIEAIAQTLSRASAPPGSRQFSCVASSSDALMPPGSMPPDWMSWSVWCDADRTQFWICADGGIVGGEQWYGPGDRSVLDALNRK